MRRPGVLDGLAARGGRAGDAPRAAECADQIQQPSGGVSGQATDIEIHAREIIALRERLVSLYADHTGEAEDKIAAKERDNFMSPDQARDFGLIDEVVTKRAPPPDLAAEEAAAAAPKEGS